MYPYELPSVGGAKRSKKVHAHVDPDREAVGEELLRSDDIDVLDGGGTGGVEVRMVARELSAVSCSDRQILKRGGRGRRTVHPSSDLAGPLVGPANGSQVGFVIHKPAVEVRFRVRVCSEEKNERAFVNSEGTYSCW